MKRFLPLAFLLVAACSAAPEPPAPAAASPAAGAPPPALKTAPAPEPAPTDAKRANATGTIQSIDAAAPAVTIAHGPVDSLGWPAMTMAFKAPGVDLSAVKAGDEVDFEFASTGMDGTITSISKR